MSTDTWAVIMAGGAGTRFWPASRRNRPKQLLALVTEKSLLLETIHRIAPSKVPFNKVLIVAGPHLESGIAEAIDGLGCRILVEPEPRNTAPCIGLAATVIAAESPQAVMAVLPADHFIEDKNSFCRAFDLAVDQSQSGVIATLGVAPDRPETGFGYVHRGVEVAPGVFQVEAFVEKPDRVTAKQYLASGDYDWNAGMFFMRVDVALEAIDRHLPNLSRAMQSYSKVIGTDIAENALKDAFKRAESISIDYGIMEKESANIVDIPCDMGWSDLGSWRTLIDFSGDAENFVIGPTTLTDVSRSVVVSQGPHVAVIGMSDVAVVATEDAVLVTPLDRAQEVGAIPKHLVKTGKEDLV